MRLVTIVAAIFLSLSCTALPCHAQWFARNFTADSFFRVEYLSAIQTLGNDVKNVQINQIIQTTNGPTSMVYPNPLEVLRIDFSNHHLVLDGMVEITPRPAVSGRIRGSASALDANRDFTLETGPVPIQITNSSPFSYGWAELSTTIRSPFWFWEVAGLYNMIYEDCYRYSLVAGYRQESLTYQSTNSNGNNSYLHDVFLSRSPFLGLQTAMLAPSWRARFEVLGSYFMQQKINHWAQQASGGAPDGKVYHMRLDGTLTDGGFVELQVEGNVNVAPNGWMGIYAQYTYESLKGDLTGVSVSGQPSNTESNYVPTPYNYYTLKNIWLVGLNFNVIF